MIRNRISFHVRLATATKGSEITDKQRRRWSKQAEKKRERVSSVNVKQRIVRSQAKVERKMAQE
jgi:hypothetical protein